MKKLGFKFEEGGQHEAARDDWQRGATGYRVTFTYDRRIASFDFWQGSGITDDPTAEGVMYCLVSDAQAGSDTFEWFCGNMGYDEDSRAAERTWKACQRIETQLSRLFGADFDEAMSTDWDEVQV